MGACRPARRTDPSAAPSHPPSLAREEMAGAQTTKYNGFVGVGFVAMRMMAATMAMMLMLRMM